jgi:hypothetical protein
VTVVPSIDPSVKITKTILHKGVTRTWSNRYHFDNLKPADNTKWTTLCDAIVAAEKLIYDSAATITGAVGYDAGSEIPVFSKSYSQAGTASFANTVRNASEVAALVRYSTGQRSVKNHPIYLFNYYHLARGDSTLTTDDLNTAQRAAMLTYANAWVSGFSDGAVTHHRCGPQGHVALGATVAQYVTHRDFPRG